MRRYLKNVFFAVILMIISDFFIGNILEYYYFNVKSGVIFDANESFTKTKSDILIFGSSRANRHYNPKIIENETNMTCYNTGRDGYFIFYQTALLQSILKRYTPKKIILDFSGSLSYSQKDLDRLAAIMPYYENNKEINYILNLKSNFEFLKLNSKLYRYNSMLTTIIKGNYYKINKETYKGFKPLFGQMDDQLVSSNDITQVSLKIDKDKMFVLEEFFRLSKKNNIELIVVLSPMFEVLSSTHNESVKIIKSLSKKYKFEFIDFSDNMDFLGKHHLFKDKDHLNSTGADLFIMPELLKCKIN